MFRSKACFSCFLESKTSWHSFYNKICSFTYSIWFFVVSNVCVEVIWNELFLCCLIFIVKFLTTEKCYFFSRNQQIQDLYNIPLAKIDCNCFNICIIWFQKLKQLTQRMRLMLKLTYQFVYGIFYMCNYLKDLLYISSLKSNFSVNSWNDWCWF